MYLIALPCAKRYIYIANPYFIPDLPRGRYARRGMPEGGYRKADAGGQIQRHLVGAPKQLAALWKTLEAGVEIYEYQPTMLHQKTMIVDGVWATVGTANFDNRSFALNEETNICFHDAALIEQLRAVFFADLARCERIQLSQWKKRGARQRAMEMLASLIENQV